MFIPSSLHIYDATKTVKHEMEKVAQQHARNFFFLYLGETTRIHSFRLSLQSLPNAHGCCWFCRYTKTMGSHYTDIFWEWNTCWTQGTTDTSSHGSERKRTFCCVWMACNICLCIMTQLLLRIILSGFFLSRQGRHCFYIHKKSQQRQFCAS